MGKKRASKDRAYLTATEWREEWGGHKGAPRGVPFSRLPFSCCAISFEPFEDAVCSRDGTVMELTNAVPYVRKLGKHPVTGEKLALRDLIRLHWHRNARNEYACPTLGKVFTPSTHIVAIATTGNVFCFDAIDQLCLKAGNLRDPLDDTPFVRSDVIDIQDPADLGGRETCRFDHVQKRLDISRVLEKGAADGGDGDADRAASALANPSAEVRAVLGKLGTEEARDALRAGGGGAKAQAERALAEANGRAKGGGVSSADPEARLRAPPPPAPVERRPGTATWNSDAPGAGAGGEVGRPGAGERPVPPPYSTEVATSHTTTGRQAMSFTSTAVSAPVRAPGGRADANERETRVVQLRPTVKGYARLTTSLGPINLELHCDLTPKTCENFLALCEAGYYDGTVFHRSIRHFMLQGGDPTGTGKGGRSVWSADGFEDEIDPRLTHAGRGVLSMANSGPGTNGSQFFITYKSARHLDGKHTVFGRVVGGFETLSKAEAVPTGKADRPAIPIVLQGVEIFANPYRDLLEERKKAGGEAAASDGEGGARSGHPPASAAGRPSPACTARPALRPGASPGSVGKYLPAATATPAAASAATTTPAAAARPAPLPRAAGPPATKKAKAYGDFDAW